MLGTTITCSEGTTRLNVKARTGELTAIYRCGKEGHIARDCKGEEVCIECGAGGHRENTTACPVFRRMIEAQRTEGSMEQ